MRWRLSEFLQHQHALQDARKLEAEISKLKLELRQLDKSLQSKRSDVCMGTAEIEQLLKQVDSYDRQIERALEEVQGKEAELHDVSGKVKRLKGQCSVLEARATNGQDQRANKSFKTQEKDSGVSVFRCICGRGKSKMSSLYNHFRRCTAQSGVFICPVSNCASWFKCRKKMEKHVKDVHSLIYPRPPVSSCSCADCGGSFECSVTLTRLQTK